MNSITFVGMDVHKATITVAVARDWREVEDLGTILNTPEAVAKLVKKLGPIETLSFCYEAGPTGYGIYRQIVGLGGKCMVVASSLIPEKPGDRIKTDRRDARKLARLLRAGELTPVWVPDEEHEAFRQLIRAREVFKDDAARKKHQIGKFLLINGIHQPTVMRAWTEKHMQWLAGLEFKFEAQKMVLTKYLRSLQDAEEVLKELELAIEDAAKDSKLLPIIQALQSLRGVAVVTAATIVAEAGDLTRFRSARQLMAYSGLIPSEGSSGERTRRGSITRTGNTRLRRVIVEAAWHYRHSPRVGVRLKRRQEGLPEVVKAIAWKAQHRLNKKYHRSIARGKAAQVTVVAVARELLGFVWGIAQETSRLEQAAHVAA